MIAYVFIFCALFHSLSPYSTCMFEMDWTILILYVICWSVSLSFVDRCICCLLSNNNNNNILYSSLWEIKAVVRSHNEEHNNSKSLNTRTYTLLDIRPLSLNLHTLLANPKFPGIMLSLSNQNVKTLNPPLESYHPQQTSWRMRTLS